MNLSSEYYTLHKNKDDFEMPNTSNVEAAASRLPKL